MTDHAVAMGAMRRDRAPADAPYDNEDLAHNFERIVFFTEFALRDGVLRAEERETALAKWRDPIRYRLVGDAVRREDVDGFAELARRLARLTGLDIARAGPTEPDNLLVLILSREARRDAAAFLERVGEPGSAGLVYRLRTDDYSIPCAASVNVAPGAPITQALILIKGETSGLLRESCIHEEFAQVLGPANDYYGARPSIFNDDGEFALLTEHDEYLLRALYDPRLESGMDRETAMPIMRRIIGELRPAKGPAREEG